MEELLDKRKLPKLLSLYLKIEFQKVEPRKGDRGVRSAKRFSSQHSKIRFWWTKTRFLAIFLCLKAFSVFKDAYSCLKMLKFAQNWTQNSNHMKNSALVGQRRPTEPTRARCFNPICETSYSWVTGYYRSFAWPGLLSHYGQIRCFKRSVWKSRLSTCCFLTLVLQLSLGNCALHLLLCNCCFAI